MTIAVATDALDGYFARKLNQITELGKILDPIADKVAIGVIASILTVQGRFPIWLFSAIIVRDLLILTGGIYLKNKYHLVLQSNWMGKWTVVSIALCLLLAVLNNPSLDIWTTIISLITGGMVLGSFVSYGWRFVIVTRSSSKT
jgi:CDP-diacylglycerol--glycerol-3-phosphate 3-phosphatidyltransferase